MNWDEVLGSLPNRFAVDDVLKHPGAAAKGRNQVYPALTRWEAAKRIRRVSKGVYEKGGTAVTKAAGKPTRRRSAAPRKRGPRAKTAAPKKARGKQKTTATPVAA